MIKNQKPLFFCCFFVFSKFLSLLFMKNSLEGSEWEMGKKEIRRRIT